MSDHEYQPLQGDPDLLQQKANHYADIAEAIARSVTTLRKIHDVDDMKSQATEKLKDSSDDVAKDIEKAHDRYSVTASALLTYSSHLRTAQQHANSAISRINSLQSSADSAHHALTKAKSDADDATGADATDAKTALTKAQQDAESADQDLSAAQDAWRAALKIKTDAAHTAAQAIIDVVDHNNHGLEDSWWDDWGSALFSILKTICDIAGILAIFLAWVPILGEVLLILAAIGAVIDLVESIVKAINGEGSWWDVAFAAAGAVLTIFGGKIFEVAAKNLKALTVVKSGLTDARDLAKLQGVGRHSEEFMDIAKATKQLEKPLSDVFTSPFVRDEAAAKLMAEFKNGSKSFSECLKAAAKEGFPGLRLDLKGAAGINSDLLSFYKMAAKDHSLVDLPTAVNAGVITLYQAHEIMDHVDLDHLSNPGNYLEGKYGDLYDAGKSIGETGRQVYDIATKGTSD